MITLIIQYVFSTLQNIYNMEMQLLTWIDGRELIWVYLTCYQVNICLFFNKFTESGINNFLFLSLSLSLSLSIYNCNKPVSLVSNSTLPDGTL